MRFPDFFEAVDEALPPEPPWSDFPEGQQEFPDGADWIWMPPWVDGVTGDDAFILLPDLGPEPPVGSPPPPEIRPTAAIPTDALAIYKPWHLWGKHWGIYVNGAGMVDYVYALSADGAGPVGQVAPFVLRSVIDHELGHFSVEVGAALIEDATRRPCYRDYLFRRFKHPNTTGVKPLEEAYASWREARSRRFAGLGAPPAGLLAAVRRNLSRCGPGYSNWEVFGSPGADPRRQLISLVAGAPLAGDDWFEAAFIKGRPQQVPLYWAGSPSLLAWFGGLPKAFGQIPIRRLRKWLQTAMGAIEVPRAGKGSHERWKVPGHGTIGFGQTRDKNLNPRDVRQVSAALGVSPEELFRRVMGH